MSYQALPEACDVIPDMVIIAEPHAFRIVHANHAAQQITGLARQQIEHLTLLDLHPHALRAGLTEQLHAIIETDRDSADYEGELLHYAAATPPVIAMKISRIDIEGQVHILGIGRDITSHHHTQNELQNTATRYAALLDGLSDLMFRITEDGIYREFHIPPGSGLTVPDPDNIIGRKVEEVVPPDVAAVAMPAIRQVVRTGKTQTIEYTIQEFDGVHYYEARFVPSLLNEIIAIVRDITERKQQSEALRFSEKMALAREPEQILVELLKRIRHVIDYDTASAMLVDNTGNIARTVATEDSTVPGLSEQKWLTFQIDKTPYLALMIQNHVPCISPDVTSDPKWIRVAGSEWIQSWLSAPIIVGDDVRGFFTLKSRRKYAFTEHHVSLIQSFALQAAVALQNAWYVDNIRSLERVKSEIIDIASHDLRNPLMRIQEFLRQIRADLDTHLTQQQRDTLTQMVGSARDMEHIITNILSLRRIENQHRESQPIHWDGLLTHAIAATQEELSAHKHTLVIDIAPDLPTTRGNPFKLERVIYNLIHNAIKYTPAGGHITVRAFQKPYGLNSTLVVEVEDNGIGISEDAQANLFQPFYRINQPGAERISGTGLGLSMVKATIEEHNGTVYVDSVPGQGSLFGFWVPA